MLTEMIVPKIDVVMITKNSVIPCLDESLDSVARNISLNKLIVVDSFSVDDTIQKIKDHKDIDSKIIQVESTRGKARGIGIRNITTELFAFVDSDVILSDGWFDEIIKHLTATVGAVEGNVKMVDGKAQKIRQSGRGYTNCTLIRSESVKGILIPEEIQIYEDQFIRKFIERKGYKWVKVREPCSTHNSMPESLGPIWRSFELGRMCGKYHLYPLWRVLIAFIIVSVKKTAGIHSEDPKIYYMRIKGHLRGLYERLRKSSSIVEGSE